MSIKTLSQFKSRLATGGARPNLFEANINFPSLYTTFWNSDIQEDFQFFCKATSMPATSIGVVDIPFRGRILKVGGDRTFEPWTVTVINDEDYNVRKAFEAWANKINNMVTGEGDINPNSYMGNGQIRQLSRKASGAGFAGAEGATETTQEVTHTYECKDIWPSEIGSIDLSYDSSDAIEEFSVTFQVEYITSSGVVSDVSSTAQSGNGDATVSVGTAAGLYAAGATDQ